MLLIDAEELIATIVEDYSGNISIAELKEHIKECSTFNYLLEDIENLRDWQNQQNSLSPSELKLQKETTENYLKQVDDILR